MAKRVKKAPIKPEQRREWLRRHEECGESPPHIAATDHYDIRTVRKQIDLAKAEREMREARTAVLRNALESHYADLRKYAERLNSELTGAAAIAPSPDDDLIEAALREHLPRSPMWSYRSKRELLKQTEGEQRKALRRTIEGIAKADRTLARLADIGLKGVIPGVTNVLVLESDQWLHGSAEYSLRDHLVYEPAGEGRVNPRFGACHMGEMAETVAKEHMPAVADALAGLEAKTRGSDEYLAMVKTIDETKRLDAKLRAELAIIRLRRIVPGRCKYCPL